MAWRGHPFAGAPGQRKADKFDTEGVNIRARKAQAGARRAESLMAASLMKDAMTALDGKSAQLVNPKGATRRVVSLYL